MTSNSGWNPLAKLHWHNTHFLLTLGGQIVWFSIQQIMPPTISWLEAICLQKSYRLHYAHITQAKVTPHAYQGPSLWQESSSQAPLHGGEVPGKHCWACNLGQWATLEQLSWRGCIGDKFSIGLAGAAGPQLPLIAIWCIGADLQRGTWAFGPIPRKWYPHPLLQVWGHGREGTSRGSSSLCGLPKFPTVNTKGSFPTVVDPPRGMHNVG